ncbi:MAG: hypothetical protein [Wendovervirus sonii]|uniref:Cyclic-phosphate processing Receiver domain-containing protein n=1 Tax=phage Lak_Megaphage_Sonny TaxID=3109229 RepID=A0ABZ0Z6L1_9CAUD|nr:MAG: hypothetical protein [phage Lak_Megaphage_Sonny]
MTKNLLWIDDIRDPETGTWLQDYSPIGVKDVKVTWVKNYNEFRQYINTEGIPDAICFDHDLADIENGSSKEKTGYDCAKYLVDVCLEMCMDIPLYNIQSSNPAGKKNIRSLLNNYHNFYIKNFKNIKQ